MKCIDHNYLVSQVNPSDRRICCKCGAVEPSRGELIAGELRREHLVRCVSTPKDAGHAPLVDERLRADRAQAAEEYAELERAEKIIERCMASRKKDGLSHTEDLSLVHAIVTADRWLRREEKYGHSECPGEPPAQVERLRAENEGLRAGLDHIDDDLIKELNAQIAIVKNSRTETWENRPITSPNHNAGYINECDRRLRVARAAILSKSIRLMEDSVVALASMDL